MGLLGATAAYLCDLSAFVVATQECHVCWISSLEQHEQSEHLQAVITSVNKIPHKDVACVGYLASSFKQSQHVMKLAVYVSTNLLQSACRQILVHCMADYSCAYTLLTRGLSTHRHRCLNWLHVGFLYKYFLHLKFAQSKTFMTHT